MLKNMLRLLLRKKTAEVNAHKHDGVNTKNMQALPRTIARLSAFLHAAARGGGRSRRPVGLLRLLLLLFLCITDTAACSG
mgnify:CR=1 FL=1